MAGTLLCFLSSNLWAWFSANIEEALVEKLAYTYTLGALTSFIGAVESMVLSVSLYHEKECYNLAVDSIILRVSITFQKGVKLPVLILWESASTFVGYLLLAGIIERKEKCILLKAEDAKYVLLSSLFKGGFLQNVYVWSFAFTPPKLAAMISITVPSITYVLNVIIRKEKLSRSMLCMVKVVSIFVGPIAIAVILFFFNGGSLVVDSKCNAMAVIAGTLFTLLSSNLRAWFSNNIEEVFIKELACTYTLEALTSLPGAVGSMIIAVSLYHDKEYYNLAVDSVTLKVSVGFTVLLSLITTMATKWSVQEKGVAYVASFSNVSLFLGTFTAPLVLHGEIEMGSGLSSGLLAVCLVAFFWANEKEKAAAPPPAAADIESQTENGEEVHEQHTKAPKDTYKQTNCIDPNSNTDKKVVETNQIEMETAVIRVGEEHSTSSTEAPSVLYPKSNKDKEVEYVWVQYDPTYRGTNQIEMERAVIRAGEEHSASSTEAPMDVLDIVGVEDDATMAEVPSTVEVSMESEEGQGMESMDEV